MFQIILSTLRLGLRARAIQSIIALGFGVMALAYLAASFSGRQPQTVALDMGISGLRLVLILLVLFWVQEFFMREIERKTVILYLSYPAPRWHYLLGRYVGIAFLTAIALVMLGLLLWLVTLNAGKGYAAPFPPELGAPFWMALTGLWVDVLVVAAMAMLLASFATVALMPFAVGAAFAVAAKMVGPVRDYIKAGADGDKDIAGMAPLLDAVHSILPDLSRLDWRVWPMYGMKPASEDMLWAGLMAFSYIGILLLLAVAIFGRRELN